MRPSLAGRADGGKLSYSSARMMGCDSLMNLLLLMTLEKIYKHLRFWGEFDSCNEDAERER